jgi:hypothetical protein
MKKILAILLVLGCFASGIVAQSSFVESIAGSLIVSKMKVGVLIVDPQSYVWPLSWGMPVGSTKTVVNPDSFLSAGIKAEIINKGGTIMVLNPPGMEKVVSPFVVMKSGQLDVRESLAAMTPSIVTKAVTTLTPEALGLIREMFDVNEFTGENPRIDQYVSTYLKVLKLWGIQKLITIEAPAKFNFIIRGYDITEGNVTASLVFQYFLKADAVAFGTNMKKPSNELKNPDFNVKEDAKVKPEESEMNNLAVIKRIAEYLK